MSELKKLIINCKNAITQLSTYIECENKNIPTEIGLIEMRDWFLIMQGYAECLEDNNLIAENN